MVPCPFCERIMRGELTEAEAEVVAFPDGFPVSHGHTLVAPRRCVADYLELTERERAALWRLVDRVAARLRRELTPDGLNIGLNVGAAAGQTVAHVHVHVIPRYRGDVADPRGGVRWVLPERARYW